MVEPPLAPATLPPNVRVYAIGDVHGCLDRLVALHWAITADLAARPVAESVLVHLGDYVDRGPDSAGVVWLLTGSVAPAVTRRVDLRGNHEAMMAAALDGNAVPSEALVSAWSASVPLAHRQWIKNRPLLHREGGYLFVHAGIRPGLPVARQLPEDLLWIREPFLSFPDKHPLVVVHGHTPEAAPQIRANRIGIDTGAVMGGDLTCVVLESDRMRFLTA